MKKLKKEKKKKKKNRERGKSGTFAALLLSYAPYASD
jgi:hypothetical protein